MLLTIEFALTIIAAVLALIAPNFGASWFERCERWFGRLARRRRLAVVSVGLLALALRAALLPILPIPEAAVHDEFGYLLAADTFVHGRLTNPAHPMWVHFETFSVIQKPTYQCFAQPAQGVILALGKAVFGHPFWGVWLSVGLMCAAICWMLQGWFPAEWALLGGVLAVLRFGVFGYWANSYWGGAAGAIGGALVLGSLPRIKRNQRLQDAILMGLGLGILANSRPYEGFVLSLPVAVALFAWMCGKTRPAFAISFSRVVTPLMLILSLAAVGTGYYFWRLTGSPLRMPYQVERQTYAAAPYLLWESPLSQPTYHHPDLENVYLNGDFTRYKLGRTGIGFLYFAAEKVSRVWRFFFGPALTLPLVVLAVFWLSGVSEVRMGQTTRFLLVTLGVSLVGWMLALYFSPHFAAPATSLMLALVVSAMQWLRDWRCRGRVSGLFLTRAIPVICCFTFLLRVLAGPTHLRISVSNVAAWHERAPTSFGRAALLSSLQRLPGSQLVIVRYKPHRIPDEEWVYNDADIDAAKVVWAREMSPSEDAELIRYFANRKVWLMDADETPPKLSPYPTESRIGALGAN